MPNGNIIVSEERATRVITLRRPGKKNAITQDMYREMSRAIDTAQNNPDVRCMIITGGSGVFTAGDDIDDFIQADAVAPRDAVGRRQDSSIRWPSTSSRSSPPWTAPRSRAWAP